LGRFVVDYLPLLSFIVIHQFAQAGFPEEPPENEQSVLIFADFRVQQVL
jgi:hypothetical protein